MNAQSQSYQEVEIPQCPQYVEALLACSERKVCTNLANSIDTTHDTVYKEMQTFSQSNETSDTLKDIAADHLDPENIHVIFDDVKLSKIYAQEIEGLEVSYDASTKQKTLGLTMVTSLLSDKTHSIPIEALPYVGKALMGVFYKTKSAIAIGITKYIVKKFKIKRVLADAHYSTQEMLRFLYTQMVAYLMKIPRNRKVIINGETGQLQHLLRLKKNAHTASAQGTIFGIPCYFYVVKIRDRSTVYFTSNDLIDAKQLLSLYRIRWKIELFHRTGKQSFGMNECQMRAIEKQRQHVLFTMHAYALAECIKVKQKFNNIEEVVRCYRS